MMQPAFVAVVAWGYFISQEFEISRAILSDAKFAELGNQLVRGIVKFRQEEVG